jgi:hypothetical protein
MSHARGGPAPDLEIDGRPVALGDPRQQRLALVRTARDERSEVWLTIPGGPAFALYKCGERALCLYLRDPDDPGFSSRQCRGERRRGHLSVHLSNGERSGYPASWTVPFFVALRAADQFLRTGERPAFIRWHDDR